MKKISEHSPPNCEWREVTLYFIWNQDGDVVVDMWEDSAEFRMREAYGGEIVGRKTETVMVPTLLPENVVKALADAGVPGFSVKK